MDLIERAARAIYESKLLVQPREPWRGGASVTEVFCMQAARAVIAIVAEEFAQVAEYEGLLDHTGEPDSSAHNYAVDRIAYNIRNALENLDIQREIERLP